MALKIYGTDACSDSREAREALTAARVPFEFVDILQNLPNLKAFLQVRDQESIFDEIRERGGIGIPLAWSEETGYTFEWKALIKTEENEK